MTNQPPPAAIRVILDDLEEESTRIVDEDDIWFFDDEMEDLLPKVARRILQLSTEASDIDKYNGLIAYLGIIARFVQDPSLMPPEEET